MEKRNARAPSMERNIEFLQKQHKDALETLHAEIDRLNRENKELQFKLIMESPEPSCKASSCVTQRIHTESNKFQADLQQNVEFPCLQLNTDTSNQLKYQETSTSSKTTKSSLEGPADAKAGFITSLQPLMIQFSPYQVPRPPSLYECEVLIRQLYRANSMQSQEVRSCITKLQIQRNFLSLLFKHCLKDYLCLSPAKVGK
ncbi:hypothetical protein DNTS_003160 [Danionella cerebrum]|uniref:CCDC92/74 N-terminal domain-containing protein n=1 Tax=Danionella cerebrum TaxID=2873325 RepID=A0A553N5X5_9TELE|nr:hypothetical protein DNTS_003160 [Danionella translucida]TRY60826.1 hypothetical protein DNTS_003160 [Danionella translucida]